MVARSTPRFKRLLAHAAAVLLGLGLVGQARAELWLQLGPSGGPPSARERHTAVYDPGSKRMIVFGGRDTGLNAIGDVWVLENADGLGGTPNWMQLSPTGTPPGGRILHTAVYDAGTNRMIVFAGRDGSNSTVGDLWLLTNANGLGGTPAWTQLSPTGTPPADRYRHAAVYDPSSNRMIVFGGAASGSGYVNDVWVLTNANGLGGTPAWTELSPTGGPPGVRSSTSAVYDASTNRMIVFGGWDNAPAYNDVWVLTNANGLGGTPAWTQLSPTGGPPTPRTEHTAVYDPAGNRMIVFGGDDVSGFLNDVWVLTNANGLGGTPTWMLPSVTGTRPSARILHTAVYDGSSSRMIVFGGYDSVSPRQNDVWVLAVLRGAEVAPAVSVAGLLVLVLALAFVGLFGATRLRLRA